jgi:hypothetical protein
VTTHTETSIGPEEFIEFVSKPELRADPYPFYARLRSIEPVHHLPIGIWLLFGLRRGLRGSARPTILER